MAEPNETALLLDDLIAFLRRYVVHQQTHYTQAMALWILHSWTITSCYISPRLVFRSPEPESGKTRNLELLEILTPNPCSVFNVTTSFLFRTIKESPTLLFDEVDAIFKKTAKGSEGNEELRAILNTGYKQGATVGRTEGAGHVPTRYPVFAATALACIGELPDTIQSRAIIIPMVRRAGDEVIESYREKKVKKQAEPLIERLAAWANGHLDVLESAEPVIPEDIRDRPAECWDPLFAIADLAGEEWSQRARFIARLFINLRLEQELSTGVKLLANLKAIFAGQEALTSYDILLQLNNLETENYQGWHEGKGIGSRDLARILGHYGTGVGVEKIQPVDIRSGRQNLKGYKSADLRDAWRRYLSTADLSAPPLQSATLPATHSEYKEESVADVADKSEEERAGLKVLDFPGSENGRDIRYTEDGDLPLDSAEQVEMWLVTEAPRG